MITAVVLEYKDRGFVDEAIESIYKQTVKPDRIVYSTGRINNKQYKDVITLYNSTESLGERLAQVIEEYPSDMYVLLEDDDIWLPDHIEKILKATKGKERFYYISATDFLGHAEIGFNVSSMTIGWKINKQRLSQFPTIIDTVIYLEALEDGIEIIKNNSVTIHYRIHHNNWSRNSQEWKKLRDRLLLSLPCMYTGEARIKASEYLVRDYGK